MTIACDCQERSKLSAEVAQVSALLEAGSPVRSYLGSEGYDNIWQEILGCADLDATNVDTLNFFSFLRLILFSCTAYIYVDIAI